MKKIYLILLFLVTVSCFSVDLQTGDKYGTVAFYRPTAIYGIAVSVEIMINQSVIGTIKSGEYIEFNLDPGTYLIHEYSILLQPNPLFNVFKVTVEEGQRTCYSVKVRSLKNSLKLITEEPELKESTKIRWIKDEE